VCSARAVGSRGTPFSIPLVTLHQGADADPAQPTPLPSFNNLIPEETFLPMNDDDNAWRADRDARGIFCSPVDLRYRRTTGIVDLLVSRDGRRQRRAGAAPSLMHLMSQTQHEVLHNVKGLPIEHQGPHYESGFLLLRPQGKLVLRRG
jgi:hypothetical protein